MFWRLVFVSVNDLPEGLVTHMHRSASLTRHCSQYLVSLGTKITANAFKIEPAKYRHLLTWNSQYNKLTML